MRPRLLIVDDQRAFLRALCRTLNRWEEFDLEGVPEPSVAVQHLRAPHEAWHAVLLDVCLPAEEDSLLVLKAALGRRPRPRVVAMSGRATRAAIARLYEAGVDAYWDKGQGPDELRGKLRDAITRASQLPGAADAAIALHHAARGAVGAMPLADAKALLTDTMMNTAMEQASAVRSRAARLLGITPQAIRFRERSRGGPDGSGEGGS